MAGLYFPLLNLLIVFNVGTVIAHQVKNTELLRKLVIQPLDTDVNEGEPVILECQARSAIRYCLWKRDNIYSVQPGITSKYSLIGSFEHGECTMRIEEASLARDNGVWVCYMYLENSEEQLHTHGANLTVIRAPKSLQVFEGNRTVSSSMNNPASSNEDAVQRLHANVTLKIGQNGSEVLSCISEEGNPAAKILWLNEMNWIKSIQRTVPGENNTFSVISYPDFLADNNYHKKMIECQAEHEAYDRRISVYFRMFVEHPTTAVKLRRYNENAQNVSRHEITVHIGRPVAIECQADGYPLPKYFWVKRNFMGEDDLIDANSTLFVGNSLDDDGVYWCLAGNNMNSEVVKSSQNFTVKVEYPTNNVTIESDGSTAVSEGGAIHLKCQADGFPSPQIRWLKKYGNGWFHIAGGTSFIINNFTAEDQGSYHCLAFNVHNNKDVESHPVHLLLLGSSDTYNSSSNLQCRPLRSCIIYLLSAVLYISVHLLCKN